MNQTKDNGPSPHRSVIVAAAVASFLMVVFGVAYRVVAARLMAPGNLAPIAQEALSRFPFQMGDWKGEDVPLDEAIIRQTDTDAHINRHYVRRKTGESVSFYVAGGVKARDLMPHRPEVCYTGAGWTLDQGRTLKLTLRDGTELPCKIFRFSRGAFSTQKVIVLYYYIVDGRYYADVSSLRSQVWRGSGAFGYVGQVEIVASVGEPVGSDMAERLVSEFAVETAVPTVDMFKENAKTGE